MRLLLLALISSGAGSFGQNAAVTIQSAPQSQFVPISARTKPAIGVPTLGFVLAADGSGLTPLHGPFSAPFAGETIPTPVGVERIFLPPRQHYAVVEQSSPNFMSIWHLAVRSSGDRDFVTPIAGIAAHADLVAFSPTGKAAVFYYAGKEQVQVITGLPGMPAVQKPISAHLSAQVTNLLVSDDGQIAVGITANGQIALSSHGAPMWSMPWTYVSRTASFISNNHNLLISDARQKQLVLLENVDAQNSSPVVIGSGLEPDHLAICSHGDSVIALDSIHQKLWQIDSVSFAVTSLHLAQQSGRLVSLRDGHTFLLSTSLLSVLRIDDASGSNSAAGALGGTNQ